MGPGSAEQRARGAAPRPGHGDAYAFIGAFDLTAAPFVKRTKPAQPSSSLLRSRTDCMIGSKFDRASSASNSCAVSESSAWERAIAIRTSSCGVSDSRPWQTGQVPAYLTGRLGAEAGRLN